ncbi:2-phospho-L-lactate guanylyltransferase [Gordonia sp. HY002]|uniref:2-phospho-L-lactate guanylyltransferase n=1 Tax=Gordonia zhenghanii TaxID=2911516 RepID=UPI001EF12424|nr:2-phospho-L-lactate guanylyltransferase [Gordonia zhenghanii]MCF8571354.1 2-phospho-L-lactate guanylyltransferase [Gordonia zhenghanii]MCF8604866.1 2-phospho-L-lactate guanylyltransferase [Gordonia zhenghanii]
MVAMATAASTSARCTVVLAVKSLSDAKSRLTPLPASADRRALVAAMLLDTLDAVAAIGAAAVVVSPDADVHGLAADTGARVLDEPGPATGLSSLNAALAHGAAPTGPTAFLQADLPALQPDSLAQSLQEAALALKSAPAAFVADRSGHGTVLLVAHPGFTPRFGAESAQRHRDAGAVELDPDRRRWPDLRTDIDTPDDLAVASEIGLGPRTLTALARPANGAPGSTGQSAADAAQ